MLATMNQQSHLQLCPNATCLHVHRSKSTCDRRTEMREPIPRRTRFQRFAAIAASTLRMYLQSPLPHEEGHLSLPNELFMQREELQCNAVLFFLVGLSTHTALPSFLSRLISCRLEHRMHTSDESRPLPRPRYAMAFGIARDGLQPPAPPGASSGTTSSAGLESPNMEA